MQTRRKDYLFLSILSYYNFTQDDCKKNLESIFLQKYFLRKMIKILIILA